MLRIQISTTFILQVQRKKKEEYISPIWDFPSKITQQQSQKNLAKPFSFFFGGEQWAADGWNVCETFVKYMSGNLNLWLLFYKFKEKKYLEKLFLKPCRLFCIIFFPSDDWMNGWILVCENQSDLSLDMCVLFFQIMTFFNYRNETGYEKNRGLYKSAN
jgi:hypothetical protein